MRGMFKLCNSLEIVPKFDTTSVTNMYDMFYGCTSLSGEVKKEWSLIYNFETNNMKRW